MKKFILIFLLGTILHAQTQWSNYPRVTALDSNDVMLMSRSLTMKGFQFKALTNTIFNNKKYTYPTSFKSNSVLFDSLGNGVLKWKNLAVISVDTTYGYHWTGLHKFQKKVELTDDSLRINGLWYIFPATRIANSVLYDSLGNGVLKNKVMVAKADSAGWGYATRYALSLKQNQLNGTGFVKASGTTISYDNSTYSLSTHTQSEATGGFGSDVSGLGAGILKKTATNTYVSVTDNSSNWNTAYGWGNWASNFGTTAGTITQGNDSRLSDARTPTTHGNEKHSSTFITLSSLSGTSPIGYNSGTGAISISQSGSGASGYLSSTDWSTFNGKQATLVSGTNIKTINSTTLLGSGDIAIPSINGTGFVKASGTTLSYDNSTYLTGNQTITLGGILSGSGTTSILASAAAGYYMPSTSDQSNWNGKEAALTFSYPLSRSVNTVSLGYNTTNLQLTANQLNTIQDIATASSPTFAGLAAINGNSNTQSIYPLLTDTYDLGSWTKYWSNGYISQLQATIFAENTISAVGGYMFITKGQGLLPAVASVTTQIDFGQTMTVGDFVLIKSKDTGGAYKTEYMTVGSNVSGTTYNVTRDVAGAHVTDPAWADGTVYVILGQNGNGRLELNAYDTPRLSIIKQGAAYNSQTEYIRLGDLNGFLGFSGETYGIGIGEATKYLKYDPVGGLVIRGDITADNGTFNGTVNATSGKFGTATNYWSIGATGLTATSSSTDVFLNYGKTDFGQDATGGFILGYDYSATKSKFEIGSSATKLFKFDGTDLSLTGGTITGGVFQTATSGARAVLSNATNDLRYYNSAGEKIRIGEQAVTGYYGYRGHAVGSDFAILILDDGDINTNGIGLNRIVLQNYPATNKVSFDFTDASGNYFTYNIAGTNYMYSSAGAGFAGGKFAFDTNGNITKINNISATAKYIPIGDGTGFSPRLLAMSDLPALTASKVLVSDASGYVSASTVSTTTLGYLDASSSVQTQLNGKVGTSTTVNGHALSSNVTVTASDVGLGSVQNFAPTYGSLVETGGSTAMTMTGSYVKWASSNAGIYSGTTLSTANDRITIDANNGGVYKISYSVTYNQNQAGSPNVYWSMGIDGVTGYAETINASPQSENHTASSELLVSLTAGQYVELFALASTGTVTPTRVQLNVQKISN